MFDCFISEQAKDMHYFSFMRSQSGGVAARVLLACVTLVGIGVLIAFMLQHYQEQQRENHRKAGTISEYGLQVTLERLSAETSWGGDTGKVQYDGGWYTVALRRFTRNDTLMLELKSEGHMGSATDTRDCLLSLLVKNGDSVWVPEGIH
jgi:hypothetical protein